MGAMARYRIVPERSRVWIDARSSLHPIRSSTDGLEGYIDLDAGAGAVSLPVSRLSSGNPLEDREMRNRVDAKRFPTIDGTVTRIEPIDGAGRYRVAGDLVFRGVSRPCEDEVRIETADDGSVRIEGRSTFDVRDFGMQPPRILMLRVHPEVTVRVEIVARPV